MAYEVRDNVQKIADARTSEAEIIRDSEYLTVQRAAIFSGMTERAIRDLISEREITVCRPTPNRCFIVKDSLIRFMSRNVFLSKEELAEESTRRNKATRYR